MKKTPATLALLALIAFWPARAGAQQPQQPEPSPEFYQRALGAMQVQRNAALDAQVAAEARAGMLQQEVTKLTAQIEATKAKPKEEKKE